MEELLLIYVYKILYLIITYLSQLIFNYNFFYNDYSNLSSRN